MHKIFLAALLGLALSAGAVLAEESLAEEIVAEDAAPPAAPACKRAEINPVTGSVLCIDPLGAPVEPPPAEDVAPCKPGQHKGEAWTWGPTCAETPES